MKKDKKSKKEEKKEKKKPSSFKPKKNGKKKKNNPPKKKIVTFDLKKRNNTNYKTKVNSKETLKKTNANALSNSTNINIVKINNYNLSKFKNNNTENNKEKIRNKKTKLKTSPTNKNKRKVCFEPKGNASNYYVTSNILLDLKNKSKEVNAQAIKNSNLYKNLNDQEINSLEYEIAIIIDQRTYIQYYWSLLKKNQLILFTFYPTQDYNLVTIKICLLLIAFSLYFTINAFFFNDETMHKIHEENGAFNIITQIPQILFSSVVSAVINVILKLLSLSEKNILALKQLKIKKQLRDYSKAIKKCLVIKFIIFFFLDFIFLIFFWYYISCFCAVYVNTQIILIKDTLISFGLSMLYPFGLNLIPGMLRIPALRAQKKDKKLLYSISYLISLVF